MLLFPHPFLQLLSEQAVFILHEGVRLRLLTELCCHLIALIFHLVQLDPQHPTQLLVCHGVLKHRKRVCLRPYLISGEDQILSAISRGGTCSGKTRVAWRETAAIVATNAATVGDKLRMTNKLDSFFPP